MSRGDEFRVRLLQPNDAAALRTLRLQALQAHPECFGASYEDEVRLSVDDFARRIPTPPGGMFGGFTADERLVAIATLVVPGGAKMRHRGHIYGVYVDPAWRGTGLGRAILSALIDRARDAGLLVLLLAVTVGNPVARGLYLDFGFQTYGVEPRALRLDDRLLDEELMALMLD